MEKEGHRIKRSIKKQLTSAMLGLFAALALALILLCAAGAGLMWRKMAHGSQMLGVQAAQDSAAALEQQAMGALAATARDMARLTDEKMQNVEQKISVLTGLLTELYADPGGIQRVPRNLDGQPALHVMPGTAQEVTREEEELLQGCAGMMRQLIRTSPDITACYVATQSGLLMLADASGRAAQSGFDARTREWYQACVRTNRLQWTGPFDDAMGRGLGMVCAVPFYDQTGALRGVAGIGMLLEDINHMLLDVRIGKTGHAFITDRNGKMVLSRDIKKDRNGNIIRPSLSAQSGAGMAKITADIAASREGAARTALNGQEVFLGYAPLTNLPWQLVTVAEVDEVLAPAQTMRREIEALAAKMNQSAVEGLFPVAAVFGAIIAAVVAFSVVSGITLARKITDPILRLARSARQLQNGFFICEEVLHTGDELEELSIAFCAMTRQLETQMQSLARVTADKERIATELDVASRIQSGMLPCIFPAFPHIRQIDLYAEMTPALEVGGDFYDFFLIGENRLGVVIADVSGKGVPSALFMVIAKTLLQNHAQLGYPPAQTLERCNRQLCQSNEAGLFVTAFMGVLELDSGRFSFCCAGHNPPLLLHEKRWSWLKTKTDFVLAGMPDICFSQQEVFLRPNDALFLYTDGVTEALNAEKTLYSEERLLDSLNTLPADTCAAQIAAHVSADVRAHMQDAQQSDDITMLALIWKGGD